MRRSRLGHGWMLLLVAFGACAESAATTPAPPSLLPDAESSTPDGARGWARVESPRGVQLLPYVAFRGHAIYQGDLDLGPIMNVDARNYGSAVAVAGRRWPEGRVDVRFDPAFTGAARAAVVAAMGELAAVSPFAFHVLADGQHSDAWIDVTWAPGGGEFAAGSTAAGLRGGDLHCSPFDGCRSDGGQWLYFAEGSAVDAATARHLLLHALGEWHPADGEDGVLGDLGVEDVNRLWQHHNRALGTGVEGDGFGRSLAVGDFDGDGYDDAAIGAPGDDVVATDSGAVYLFKGTATRLVPWKVLSQLAVPGEDAGAGDGFGAALAAGDLDGDGLDDLVVGVPGEDLGALVDSGAVHVFAGGAGGVHVAASYRQADAGGVSGAGDHFGAAVAIGHLTGSGTIAELVIGAPGDQVTTPNGSARSGAVYVLHGGAAARPTRLVLARAHDGDQFGAALATGAIDADGRDDLAVGAPGAGGGRGAVAVYAGRTPAEADAATWSAMAHQRALLAAPGGAAGDHLGAAVVIADVSGPAGGEVVAGAPGANRALVFRARGGGFVPVQTLTGDAGASGFGSALAAYQRDVSTPSLDLAVGAPGTGGTGGVALYTGTTRGLTAEHGLRGGAGFGAALAVGRLDGSSDTGATAAPLLGATLDLVTGVAGAPGGGAITVFLGGGAGTLAGDRTYAQESADVGGA